MADASDVFHILQKHGVPFVVIGGHAVNAHGFIRAAGRLQDRLDLERLQETDKDE
ncbi:MAG: hypothetical protein V1929_08185 [bacterium]